MLESFNGRKKENSMRDISREVATRKIAEMPAEQVLKLLIFMAGMEAQQTVEGNNCQQTAQAG